MEGNSYSKSRVAKRARFYDERLRETRARSEGCANTLYIAPRIRG